MSHAFPSSPRPDLARRIGLALLVTLGTVALALVPAAGAAPPPPLTPLATQPPIAFPIEAAYGLQGCKACHGQYDGSNDIEPFDMWAGTMMANAGRDPVFWAALDVANNDLPGAGEFCLRCHAPKAWLEGRVSAAAGTTDGCYVDEDNGMQGNIDEGADNDFEGVTCHLCHRMMVLDPPIPPGELDHYTENAQFWIDDEPCDNPDNNDPQMEPCRRGPYDYPPPDIQPPHDWEHSTYHTESRFCGTCHNVTNPVVTLRDESGQDTGIPYPVERTYDEWLQSDYSIDMGPSFQSCQGCHMPQVDADPAFACGFANNDRTGDMRGHDFVGGNAWVPGLLRDQYGSTLPNGDAFDNTIARAQQMLAGAAELALTAPPEVGPEGTLGFSVRVTNLSGHKLPTGYNEGRRMWIHVEVEEGDGDVIWESGAYDPVTGDLDRDPQVKVYESRRGIWNALGTDSCDFVDIDGVEQFHFVLDDCIALDNRIPPLGFTGGSDPETQPVGYDYPETSPGSGILVHHDDTDYSVPLPAGALTPLTVRATLRYQTSSKEYIEFLRDESVALDFPDDCISRTAGWSWPAVLDEGERSRGEFLYWLWENGNRSAPVDMVVDASVVAIDADIFADGFESGDTSGWDSTIGD